MKPAPKRMRAAIVGPLILAATAPAAAQHADPPRAGPALDAAFGVHAVPLVTHATPMLGGASRTEVYLTQPTLHARAGAFGGAVRLDAAVSLEGLTLDRGELGAGMYGEGYIDRRHPHTYLHELVLSAQQRAHGVSASVAAGRGFAPFGTDDPMMRPFVKFPVNHHLGQLLERPLVIGGIRGGPVMIEAGWFSGSEPLDPEDTGSLEHFGNSWSARLTLFPLDGLELQASRAWVVSPELPAGGGWDQRKWSAAARYERPHDFGSVYVMAEWKRTTEVDRGVDIFSFGSLLAEAAADVRGWRPALRVERSQRPEEQRASDPFRSPWPHGGGHVLGITRWTIASLRLERAIGIVALRAAPFIEGSVSHVTETAGGPFDPREFYGSGTIWTVNIGARLRAGWHPARMGRYGVAAPPAAASHAH